MNSTPQILDPCCGGKMLWFNKNDRRAAFCDRRREKHILCDGRFFEVNPDTVCDFRKLPFPDESFFLICFDPPHLLQAGETSWIKKKYGSLNRLTWSEDLSKGFDECWRVLKPGGTLIFKWNETQISLREVLSCFSRRPVFGHTTTKRRMKGERMETTISEIRSIVQRRRELEIEDQRLYQRFLELLELNQGTRKSSRDRLSPESGKALFAGLKRGSHERSKAR